jgi:hypothetical protein
MSFSWTCCEIFLAGWKNWIAMNSKTAPIRIFFISFMNVRFLIDFTGNRQFILKNGL